MNTPKPFLHAYWKYLAMINYEADPKVLQPYVPRGTELDYWNGTLYASMVGFLFLETKITGLPMPFFKKFEEVNLRFYVRRKDGDEWKRGVVFIKEIVPYKAIAFVARKKYNERYIDLPMRHVIKLQDEGDEGLNYVQYGWMYKNNWNNLKVLPVGSPAPLMPGSEEEFITEHYWGYTAQKDGSTVEYKVEHPRWLVRKASNGFLHCDVKELYGEEFVEMLQGKAKSSLLAEGSPVTVYRGTPLID